MLLKSTFDVGGEALCLGIGYLYSGNRGLLKVHIPIQRSPECSSYHNLCHFDFVYVFTFLMEALKRSAAQHRVISIRSILRSLGFVCWSYISLLRGNAPRSSLVSTESNRKLVSFTIFPILSFVVLYHLSSYITK